MQSNNCSLKTDYLEIQDEYLRQIRADTAEQYRIVATQVTEDIIDLAKGHNTDEYTLRSYLDIALELLLDLKNAVNDSKSTCIEDDNVHTVYNDLNWNSRLFPYPRWPEDDEINICALTEIISKYLSYEWFSSPIFEHVIINAYLRYNIEINRKAFKKNSEEPSYYFQTCVFYGVVGIITYWLMPVALIILALSAAYSFNSILTEIKAQKDDLKALLALIDLKTYVSAITWSPTAAINRVNELDKRFYIPELIPLVSKMINRNPNTFNAHPY